MADLPEVAVYAPKIDEGGWVKGMKAIAASSTEAVKATEGVVVADEKLTRATRTTVDGFAKLEAKYDRMLGLEQRRTAEIQRATRYLNEGTVSLDRYRALVERVNGEFNTQADRLRRVQTETDRAAGSFGGLTTMVGSARSIMGAFGVTLGLVGLVQFGRHVIDTVGGLGEMAEQMGVTTQALQVYQFTADQAGLKQEQLATGLQFFTRRIGEAAEGNDEAIDSFRKLGIGILDAGGNIRPTESVLEAVAARLSEFEDPARRATAAAELFGARGGARMLPMLTELSGGMDALTQRAREAGAVVGDDLIRQFDLASDSFARWGQRVTVLAANHLGFLLDQLQNLATFDFEALAHRHMKFLDQFGIRRTDSVTIPMPPPPSAAPGATGMGAVPGGNPTSSAEAAREEALRRYIDGLENAARVSALETAEKKVQLALDEARNKLLDQRTGLARSLTEQESARIRTAVAAEAAADAEAKLKEQAARAAEQRGDADARRNASVEAYIRGLEDTARLEALSGEEKEIQRALLEAQNKLLDEQGRKLRDLTAEERRRIETASREKQLADERARLEKRAQEDRVREATRATDQITDYTAEPLVELPAAVIADPSFRRAVEARISEVMR